MTLTGFLLARIAEDEEVAQTAEASGGDPASTAPIWTSLRSGKNGICDHGPRGSVEMSPARVLAECAAKRRIVEEHPIYRGPRILAIDSSGTDYGCELCHCIDPVRADGIIEAAGYCTTLRLLAIPYADHPDYRAEWKP